MTQSAGAPSRRPVLLFLVPEDWYFYSHRFGLACAARDAGFDVVVMTHVTRFQPMLEQSGLRVVPWESGRNSLNPLRKLSSLRQIRRAYREIRPDLVHHVALEPVVLGGLVARSLGIPCVSAIAGLGHVFTGGGLRNRSLRVPIMSTLRRVLGRRDARTIFQTQEQRDLLVTSGALLPEHAVVIPGVGADLERFTPVPEPAGVPAVLLACRLLWPKGVGEFAAAAEELQRRGVAARFVLVGITDTKNPTAIPETQIQDWVQRGVLEYWGARDDMPAVLAQSNLFCFPSYYGEGVPKVLIEAAASGRAMVVTSLPGCAEVVKDGENGLLVPPRDVPALVAALERLLSDSALRHRMGQRSREFAMARFSEKSSIAQTFAVYRDLLGQRWPAEESVASDFVLAQQKASC